MSHKTIVFQKPKDDDFHCGAEEDWGLCYPKKLGFGCYGDCSDCESMWIERYNNLKAEEVCDFIGWAHTSKEEEIT